MGPAGRRPALLLLLLLLRTAAEGPLRNAPSRTRRGLLQLAGTIQCSTGRSALAYMRYGCYCGLGGNGWPRDKTDWCCLKHDCCYGTAEKEGCTPKFERYTWKCKDKAAKCDDIEDKCKRMTCECDREAAMCLAKAPYNARHIPKTDSSCSGSGHLLAVWQ
ncbi:phospholipase A2-like [Rhineura floridana]|uniref:phospholipase A2-like n=1 Tax=Rhineura floridana TaxID=261503 RepID=UPI002AC82BF8|nr:phospholipase A2-like [Rhineura floridana]